jgi:hypothetical protein
MPRIVSQASPLLQPHPTVTISVGGSPSPASVFWLSLSPVIAIDQRVALTLASPLMKVLMYHVCREIFNCSRTEWVPTDLGIKLKGYHA